MLPVITQVTSVVDSTVVPRCNNLSRALQGRASPTPSSTPLPPLICRPPCWVVLQEVRGARRCPMRILTSGALWLCLFTDNILTPGVSRVWLHGQCLPFMTAVCGGMREQLSVEEMAIGFVGRREVWVVCSDHEKKKSLFGYRCHSPCVNGSENSHCCAEMHVLYHCGFNDGQF